jgi:hypothetical protein
VAVSLGLLPAGPAFRYSKTAVEDSVTVFLNQLEPRPGETVGVMLRVAQPYPRLCDIIEVPR